MYTMELLKQINLGYQYGVIDHDVQKVNTILSYFEKLDRNRPQIGDVIMCRNVREGVVYPNGHLESLDYLGDEGSNGNLYKSYGSFCKYR